MTPLDITQSIRARAWRDGLGLSRQRLAKLTGFSAASIRCFESGTIRGHPIGPAAWQRYRLCCAAVARETEFDWETPSLPR